MSDSEDEYTVERILDSKGEGKAKRYLVKWEGFDAAEDNTWEPAKNLHPKLIAEYEGAASAPAATADDDSDGDASVSDPDDEEYEEERSKSRKTPITAAASKTVSKAPASAAKGAPPAKKAKTAAAEIKAVVGKLGVLDRSQLLGVVQALLEDGSVPPSTLEALLPAPDMEPLFKEGQRLANAIRRALPNSRWGSCTDHFGYKRCASANNACKKYIVDHAKTFKAAKQWQAMLDYAVGMLPVASDMVHFDNEADNKTRNLAIDALTKLKAEAEAKLA